MKKPMKSNLTAFHIQNPYKIQDISQQLQIQIKEVI